jgi:DNA gyrase subunit A
MVRGFREVSIEKEMKTSYLDYSMSVIVGRALPDARDGLKPVHRRILYSMYELGLRPNSPHKKSARIVGEVMGKYHPHGDRALYDTLVRMAQNFSMRYMLVDGQGNFGSMDGDSAAAMRYTEARMSNIALEMLTDIDKETVDFIDNFDGSLEEPIVFPTSVPNLLINGSDGIAVGMSTKIPPHNLEEVIDALIALVKDPEISIDKLMKHIKGPDFPTGGFILGNDGIKKAYTGGKGRIRVRGRVLVEQGYRGKESIVVIELPYQVNKAGFIEQVAELVKKGKIDGISDIRDESDRDGVRVVFELKKGANQELILNQMYKQTYLETGFSIILLALIDRKPEVMSLKKLLEVFVEHRREVVKRRSIYLLDKLEKRAHILEGLKIAIENIDEVVEIIKSSRNVASAQKKLMSRFSLTDVQAKAILDMRLARLTSLERSKLDKEYEDLLKEIEMLKSILASEEMLRKVIVDEFKDVKKKYGDPRRTEIVGEVEEMSVEDLIADDDKVITITNNGYIKSTALSTYRSQKRGGVGYIGADTSDDDFVKRLFTASAHQYLLFFSDKGICYWQKVYDLPAGGRASKGRNIKNLLEMDKDENITAVIPIRALEEDGFLMMATRTGIVKKTELSAFSNPRKGGIIAIKLEDDELIDVKYTTGNNEIMLVTKLGQSIRFHERDVRPTGRNSKGVIGIRLMKGDEVVSMVGVREGWDLLVATEGGKGKKTKITDYPLQKRGGKGVKTIDNLEKVGYIVGSEEVTEGDEVMCITSSEKMIRVSVDGIRRVGRSCQGVNLLKLSKNDKIVAFARVEENEEAD